MKILGFSIEKYDRDYLDKLTDVQLNEIALNDNEDTFIYDDVRSFTDCLNGEFVDVDNNWVYPVNVD